MKKTTSDGHIWELVSEEHQIWKAPDGLLWSDVLPEKYNFDKAQEAAKKLDLLKFHDVVWHVPTRKEWLQFEIFDGREVVPNMKDHWFWSSSPAGYGNAWGLGGSSGGVDYVSRYRYGGFSVRCAGR